MKRRNLITALALTLSMGIGTSVYAASTVPGTTTKNSINMRASKGLGMNRMHDMKGKDEVESILTEKFGVTADELKAAREAGKSIQDLITEKGISQDDFKAAMLEVKYKAIDEEVTNGKLTQEQADKLKAEIKENCENGVSSEGRHGNKNMFNMKGKNEVESVLTEKFGITADELKVAREASKSIQDLITEKGISQDEFKAAMLEARYKTVDEAVASGKLTQEQADKIKADIKEKCENAIPGEGRQGGKSGMMKGKKEFNSDKMNKRNFKFGNDHNSNNSVPSENIN